MTGVVQIAIALCGAALAAIVVAWLFAPDHGPVGAHWGRYARWIDGELRALFLRRTPLQYARVHLGGALAAGLAGAALLEDWTIGLVFAAGALFYGFRWPAQQRARRLARLETQIDPSLRSIAQTLRATSNVVEALESVARLSDPPISQEIDLAVRQHKLGMPLDEALREIGQRTGSRNLDAAITAMLIARSSGGNLAAMLDEVAAVLRERMRLESFIDARTSEGKAQAWVMGLIPVGVGVLLYRMDPTWMEPLFRDPIGWVILAIIVACEIIGVYWVRKVSTVEA